MRKPTVFISIPNLQHFEELYRKCLKQIEAKNKVEAICFFDEPLIGNFERTINTHIAFSNLVIGVLDNGNQNVSYELGLAKGFGKPIILVAKNDMQPQSLLSFHDIIYYDKDELDYEKLLTRIHESIDRIFYARYHTLRAQTHGQLLVKIQENNFERANDKEEDDLLKIAIREYNAKNFQGTIDILTSKAPHEIADSDDFYFFVCDSYFLESEKMEEGGRKNLYLQKMLEYANSGLELFPNNKVLLKCRGLANLKLKQLEPAKKIFEKLLREYPNYDVGRYNLACVYAQLGDLYNTLTNLSLIVDNDESWRSLARLDPDFDPLWHKDLFQRLLFPIQSKI